MTVDDIIKILESTKECIKIEEYEQATKNLDDLIKKFTAKKDVAGEYMDELLKNLH